MGATVSAPFKAMSMTNGNVNRAFGVGPSASTNTGSTASANTAAAPASTRRRRNNQSGGRRRKSRKGTYRKRR